MRCSGLTGGDPPVTRPNGAHISLKGSPAPDGGVLSWNSQGGRSDRCLPCRYRHRNGCRLVAFDGDSSNYPGIEFLHLRA
jgi:hypothetical protein